MRNVWGQFKNIYILQECNVTVWLGKEKLGFNVNPNDFSNYGTICLH